MSEPYILNGHEAIPCDALTWGKWMQENQNIRHVKDEKVGEVRISTVFLGLDHAFGSGGPPLIFETMVFGGELADEQDRYSTWDEAEAGHVAMVERVKSGGAAERGPTPPAVP